jgi:hypothetical protein
VVDDQSQAATAQLMGCESAWCVATGARFPVTDTNGTPLTHRSVVFFNFAYSGGLWQFDIDGTFFLVEERGSRAKRTSFLFFMRDFPAGRRKKGEVLDRI